MLDTTKGRRQAIKKASIAVVLLLGIMLVSSFACGGDGAPTPTPTPLPTVVMSCVEARDTIQDALIDYNDEHGDWPTADGQPGDIEWSKLVPVFMAAIPANDSKCEWWVNSDPEGEVCLQNQC